MVPNKSTDDKCVACTTSKSDSASAITTNVTGASSVSSAVSKLQWSPCVLQYFSNFVAQIIHRGGLTRYKHY